MNNENITDVNIPALMEGLAGYGSIMAETGLFTPSQASALCTLIIGAFELAFDRRAEVDAHMKVVREARAIAEAEAKDD